MHKTRKKATLRDYLLLNLTRVEYQTRAVRCRSYEVCRWRRRVLFAECAAAGSVGPVQAPTDWNLFVLERKNSCFLTLNFHLLKCFSLNNIEMVDKNFELRTFFIFFSSFLLLRLHSIAASGTLKANNKFKTNENNNKTNKNAFVYRLADSL